MVDEALRRRHGIFRANRPDQDDIASMHQAVLNLDNPTPSWPGPRRPELSDDSDKDTFVSIDASREAVQRFATKHKLVEIEGAQHGFAVHDPQ